MQSEADPGPHQSSRFVAIADGLTSSRLLCQKNHSRWTMGSEIASHNGMKLSRQVWDSQ